MRGANLFPGLRLDDGRYIVTIDEADRDGFRKAILHTASYVDADDVAEGGHWASEATYRLFHVRDVVRTTGDERREEIVLGLRQLANQIERNESIPITGTTTISETWYSSLKTKSQAADLVRSMKPVEKDYLGGSLYITKEFMGGAVKIGFTIGREEVCKKIEREVTKTVVERDEEAIKAATEAIPEREVTKTVTEVEWECEPLLAATGGAS